MTAYLIVAAVVILAVGLALACILRGLSAEVAARKALQHRLDEVAK